MNAAIFIVEVLGIVAMVVVHRRSLGIFTDRLKRQDETEEARRVALYKQQKATSKAVAQSDKAVRKMVDQAQSLADETKLANQRTDALARDVKERLHG